MMIILEEGSKLIIEEKVLYRHRYYDKYTWFLDGT